MSAIEKESSTHVSSDELLGRFNWRRTELERLSVRGSYDSRDRQHTLQVEINQLGDQIIDLYYPLGALSVSNTELVD